MQRHKNYIVRRQPFDSPIEGVAWLMGMTDEPTEHEIPADDNEPATKGYVRSVENRLLKVIKAEAKANRLHMDEQAEETRRHFDVAVEKIEDDLKGANKDEISLIKDQLLPDQDDRVQVLEKQTGVSIGPRHGSGQ